MKRFIGVLVLLLTLSLTLSAQNASEAKKVLDKTAAVVNHKGGASAHFTISSGKTGSALGNISIKGNKFYASTGNARVWYNGKTQWTYLQSTGEVNVSTPNESQKIQMNPYSFLSLYKSGYRLSMTKQGTSYQVRLKAIHPARSIQEMYITVTANYQPKQIKVKQGKSWMTINISNFQTRNLSDALFQFNSKEFPNAEIIDLR